MIDTDILFRNGDAAEEDGRLDFARQSFEQGAALGDADCLCRLARMYDEGIGVTADKRKAMRLFQMAWRRSRNTTAATNIAILYREAGKHRLMFEWYRRAADTGDGSALLDIAKCYLRGRGVRRDLQAALRCLAAAESSTYITEYERELAQRLLRKFRLRQV
jgi:TPR repeat protein